MIDLSMLCTILDSMESEKRYIFMQLNSPNVTIPEEISKFYTEKNKYIDKCMDSIKNLIKFELKEYN